MQKSTAEKLMAALAWMEHPLQYYFDLLDEISDEEEKTKLRNAVGDMMGRHFTELMIPILRQHRDLDPERNPEWWNDLKDRYAAAE